MGRKEKEKEKEEVVVVVEEETEEVKKQTGKGRVGEGGMVVLIYGWDLVLLFSLRLSCIDLSAWVTGSMHGSRIECCPEEVSQRFLVKPETIGVQLRDFMISTKSLYIPFSTTFLKIGRASCRERVSVKV